VARTITVDIVGDASQLERTFRRTAKSAETFGHRMNKNFGEVRSGTGAVLAFGRSVGLVGIALGALDASTKFITGSIAAAQDNVVAQRALAAQMKATGESFQANQDLIDKAGLSLAKYGYTSEDSEHALTVLDRATGSITKSIQLQGLAADIARAKNIDLAAAAAIVAKALSGQTTALRRAVPGLEKNAKGYDLIREAQQRMAGQAAANTTPLERFHTALHDTQVIIGSALLPALNTGLTALGKWLDKLNRSGALQRGLNTAVKDGTPLVHGLAKAFRLLGGAVAGYVTWQRRAEKALGGFGTLAQTAFGWVNNLADAYNTLNTQLNQMLGIADKVAVSDTTFPGVRSPFGSGVQPPRSGTVYAGMPSPSAMDYSNEAAWIRAHTLTRDQITAIALARDPTGMAALQGRAAFDRSQIAAIQRRFGRGIISAADYSRELEKYYNDLASVTGQITANVQAAKTAAQKTRDAAKKLAQQLQQQADAIKSALLNRLQQQQTDIQNQRALADAEQQLTLARKIGGREGIKNALRAVQDARMAILQARLEAAQPRLRRLPGGGEQFALGQVITINVHGTDSPQQVANEVARVLARRARHTSTQQRGAAAGSTSGQR
jgi:hypothetical protein